MKKKTRDILGIAGASAAAVTAGILLSATPALADDNCACTPDNHVEDCTCGCADAAEELRNAEGQMQNAAANEVFADDELKASKQYAEEAQEKADKAAADSKSADEAYDKALSDEENRIKEQQETAKANEAAALDAQAQATVKEGQAESAYNDAKAESEVAADELNKAQGYKNGTLSIEDTDEYKESEKTGADLATKTQEKDAADKALESARADETSKENVKNSAEADRENKNAALADKRDAEENARTAAEAAQAQHNADVTALNTATSEKDAADKDAADKQTAKTQADAAKTAADAANTEAVQKEGAAKQKDTETKEALDAYIKEIEEKKNSYYFFKWLAENTAASKEIRDQASKAARIIGNELISSDDDIYNNGRFSADNPDGTPMIPYSYDELIKATKVGDSTDATYLENVRAALDYIDIGNSRRAQDTFSTYPLKVSPILMAMGEVNANHLKENFRHSLTFYANENAAMKQQSYAPEDIYDDGFDPYIGWYDEEKYNYENNIPRAVTGHYRTLTGRKGEYTITGYGRIGNAEDNFYATYHSQMFQYGEGITTDEFRTLLDEYEKPFEEQLKKLQDEYDAAHIAYEQAQADAAKALEAKNAADKAATDAATALNEALATQKTKQDAYDAAVAKEAASKKTADDTAAALAAAMDARAQAQEDYDSAVEAFNKAESEYNAAVTAREQAQADAQAKQTSYNAALATDNAAKKALADIQDVDAKQAVYDELDAKVTSLRKEYDEAKAQTETAQLAYEEAQRAVVVASALDANDAESVKAALALKEQAAKTLQMENEELEALKAQVAKDEENVKLAKEAYAKAEEALQKAKEAKEKADKDCEAHIVTDKDIIVRITYKTPSGQVIDYYHTEMYLDGEYLENSGFGLPATVINTKNEILIRELGVTISVKPNDNSQFDRGDLSPEGFKLKFVEVTDEDGKKHLKAVLTDMDGKEYSGDWFEIIGEDLESGEVELILYLDLEPDLYPDPIPDPDPVPTPISVINNRTTGKATQAVKAAGNANVAKAAGGSVANAAVSAPATGDDGYSAIAGYTIIAAAAAAMLGVMIVRKKKSEK